MKKTYYVNIGTGEISENRVENNNSYTIEATLDEVGRLRSAFNKMNDASIQSFWRAHIPFVPYHNDKGNDRYDVNMLSVYEILYKCGNQDVKDHIATLGILKDEHIGE